MVKLSPVKYQQASAFALSTLTNELKVFTKLLSISVFLLAETTICFGPVLHFMLFLLCEISWVIMRCLCVQQFPNIRVKLFCSAGMKYCWLYRWHFAVSSRAWRQRAAKLLLNSVVKTWLSVVSDTWSDQCISGHDDVHTAGCFCFPSALLPFLRFLSALTPLTSQWLRLGWNAARGSASWTASVWRRASRSFCSELPLWSVTELLWWSWLLMRRGRFAHAFAHVDTQTDTHELADKRAVLCRPQIRSAKWRFALVPTSCWSTKWDSTQTTSSLTPTSWPLVQAWRNTTSMQSASSRPLNLLR